MDKNYSVAGNKMQIRRMFKHDIDEILNIYSQYSSLYHNPVNPVFINDVLLNGEIWGIYIDNSLSACCYFFPLKSKFYQNSAFYQSIADFTQEPEKYFFMGYVGISEEIRNKNSRENFQKTIYALFLNIAQMQAFRYGFKYVMHCMPIKMSQCMPCMFSEKFSLIKLRGLENLVVHYIFSKPIYCGENTMATDIEHTEKISAKNTKILSKMLEHGYYAADIINIDREPVFLLNKNQ